jgi:hypothetical protein
LGMGNFREDFCPHLKSPIPVRKRMILQGGY